MPTARTPRSDDGLTAKGQRTRRRIVENAARLMFERGVAGTTIEDVRDAAGVSNSQIYHYFADKSALVRAVIEQQTDAVVGPHEQLFANLDSLAGLRAWRDFIVEHQRRVNCVGGCPIATLGSELAEGDDSVRRQLADSFARWEHGIRAGLRAMHEAGRLRPDADPDALALATLASLQGGLLLTQLQRDVRPVETALDASLALIAAQAVT
jgi:AcrR family transcriptional regulator